MSFPSFMLSRGDRALWLTQPNGMYVGRGIEGLDNPPIAILADEPATWDGELVREVRYGAREVFLPVHLQVSDTADLGRAVRDLASLLDPKRGPVTLTVAHPDGRQRLIEGNLSAPFGGPLAAAEAITWRKVGLRMRCPDPFFTGDGGGVSFVGDLTPTTLLRNPFLPMGLTNLQISGTVTVVNDGDADTWPVWTVAGPATTLTITIDGRSWSLSGPLAAGETLIVDTRRGGQSATIGGLLAWGRLTPGADLAPIPVGVSTLAVAATGATGTTAVSATWTERWLTAW